MRRSVPFTKMSGAGNDFLVVEGLPGVNYPRLARSICRRTDGVGADGLLVLLPSRRADFRMRIINADGSEAEMCGNGARCLALYIAARHKPAGLSFVIETLAGPVAARVSGGRAAVCLGRPRGIRLERPLTLRGRGIHVDELDTGVPHAVVFVEDLAAVDVGRIGAAIREHRAFAPRGTNVDFVEQLDGDRIAVRTYERGVEAETRACGTGAAAAAVAAALRGRPSDAGRRVRESIEVRTSGGEVLRVGFPRDGDVVGEVWLEGGVRFVAEGVYWP